MPQRLGQHFLNSSKVVEHILDVSNLTGDEIVLEIGPGKGVLTEALIPFPAKLVAIEKDEALVAYLREKFQEEIKEETLEIIEQDVLKFDPSSLKHHNPSAYKVIANIPYYITGAILRHFLTTPHQPRSMTLMVQKEVAERTVAKDGKESILSISVKAFGTPHYIETVPAHLFTPPPKVDSAILHIDNISRAFFEENSIDEKKFFTLVKTGFSHKRKKLVNNLSTLVSKEKTIPALAKEGISDARAEDLPLKTWKNLYNSLYPHISVN